MFEQYYDAVKEITCQLCSASEGVVESSKSSEVAGGKGSSPKEGETKGQEARQENAAYHGDSRSNAKRKYGFFFFFILFDFFFSRFVCRNN
jgi:hypothetical protein